MAKAIIISKHGGPEVLELKDVELQSPGPNEVLIRHVAIGLNYIDVYHRTGLYPVSLPSGIGAEGAGIIKAVGRDVQNFQVGDRVSYSGSPLGAYSSQRLLHTKDLLRVPPNIDLEVAATLMIKGLTAYYLLHETYPVSSGETILFHAAAGGLGQIFCQWAKSLGCQVIGTVGSDDKIPLAKKNGCDHVINYSKENFSEKNTLEGSLESLKIRGTMVSFGNASGALPEISIPKLIQPKGLYITRPAMHHYLSQRDDLEKGAKVLFDRVESGQVKIEIFKKYKLDQVKEAHADLEKRMISGPSIIIPN
jgi:NADPH2:quinone reductase